MRLRELVSALNGGTALPGEGLDREVLDIACDSRTVREGSLFVAVRGFHSDGHRFIRQAVDRGAVAVVAEEGGAVESAPAVPVIRVPDSRRALALLAASFYGHPSRKLVLIGITGTNGKTTTSYLARSVIEEAGTSAGLIGTIDYRIGDRIYPAPNTTPESLDLQRFLAEMVGAGATHCVMEVSSHALALGRTEGCLFRVAVFTNLTQDHLDFHGDMQDYFRAKLLLFTGLGQDASAVINRDDARADEIIRSTKARVVTYGLTNAADIHPEGPVRHGIEGLSFTAAAPGGPVAVRSPLVGKHNIYNILAAIGIGISVRFSADVIGRGIGRMQAVPGRMEKVDEGQLFGVLVDYAHTEDALVRLLEAVREVARGKVITLFGCGGDRDRTKRPKMGVAAARGSDLVIVTSDNPRTEDPHAIIREIEAGMTTSGVRVSTADGLRTRRPGKTPYLVLPDRAEAIAAAIGLAETGDIVVLAGKGHEDYQVLGQQKVHFDDREEARKAIKKRQGSGDRGQGPEK